jgi:hypothetical protein
MIMATNVGNANANLNRLNVVPNTTNKGTFVGAFNSAAELASGARFNEIAEKCTIIANTLGENTTIDLSSTFGNYGPNRAASTTAATNLNKVKAFTGSANAPTRGAILIKILSEIKLLVKTRRNNNRKMANNIKTAENFNKAIINLINAVNKAKQGNQGNVPEAQQ